jgi:hypothetical protein
MLDGRRMGALIFVGAFVAVSVIVKYVSRTPLWWAPGAVALAGAFAMFADMDAPSDCHGSPVCGLDAIGRFVDLIGGVAFGVLGLIVLAVGAGLHKRHVAKRAAAAIALPRAVVR